MSVNPSAILSRAADLIRDTAGLALAPPWSQSLNRVMQGRDEDYEVATVSTSPTARWIALMSPAVAPTLETLLRVAAVEEANPSPLEYGSATISSFMTVLRELARQIVEAHDVR